MFHFKKLKMGKVKKDETIEKREGCWQKKKENN